MAFLDSRQQRAAWFILILGVGLAIALWPFTTGFVGAPVLYVIFAPFHRWLSRWMSPHLAAGITLLVALLLIVVPGGTLIGLLAGQAQDLARGAFESPLLARLKDLNLGGYDIGAQLQELGSKVATFVGSSLLGLVGTATRLLIQLTVAFFGLYFLLVSADDVWTTLAPFIPFSARNAEALRQRFKDVTTSTLIGTGLNASIQGLLVALAFSVAGLSNAAFWGVVTMIASILPIVGSGLVWVPGAAALALEHRYGWAIALIVWGLVVVGQVDNVVRPWVFRRYARIHPFVTVIGAIAGIQYFGLLGLVIGPLAISYFFELIRMYKQEYLEGAVASA